MSSKRWLTLIVSAFVLSLVASAWLFSRSRAADFDRHARAVEGIGRVRQASRLLSQQILAARYGLLNQYDPVMSTETVLTDSSAALPPLLAGAVAVDAELDESLRLLGTASSDQRSAADRFKAENAVLRNSLYYLPTAAGHVVSGLGAAAPKDGDTARLVQSALEEALVYNLIGDEVSRASYERRLVELRGRAKTVPADMRAEFGQFVAHLAVIADKQPKVDGWIKQVVEGRVEARLAAVERGYEERFLRAVLASGRYRRLLYAWSLVLLVAGAAAAVQLSRLYTDLERRVAKRTDELQTALSALWGEMKLARKIQEALVPKKPRLARSDVAAAMRPTSDVGGDYYDVVQSGAHEWILIGDVSGHGVPAGLIMMMCHTAVRTILHREPDVRPDTLLANVNAVLTENIHQLGEDKYMTISAFRRDPDGTILFAGAHQDVFVYRAELDRVETLETSGLWLGIKRDIGDTLSTRQLTLAEGDLLVLYTDGITEASRDGNLFDTDGVSRVVARARGKSAQQVLDDLFGALDGYEIADDATALVIRQLDAGDLKTRAA